MSEPTPTRTWDEYLAAASGYLQAARRTAERGATSRAARAARGPDARWVPGCRDALALGYDLLAEEVVARMSMIEQRRPSTIRTNPHREQRVPRYIDTPV